MKTALKPVLLQVLVISLAVIFYLTSSYISRGTAKNKTTPCPDGYSEKANRVRIVFYNTENLFDTVDDSTVADEEFLPDGPLHWTYSKYKAKLVKICKVIVAIGEWKPPDIIGLSEIENSHVLQDLINNTPLLKYEYRYIHKNSPDRRGIDVALLYNPATIRMLESTFIPVRLTGSDEKFTRDILFCKISAGQNDTLNIFVNHWSSRSSGLLETEPARLHTAKILRLKIDSIYRTNLHQKIIITGDFNDGPYDKSLIQGLQVQTNTESPLPGVLYNLSAGYEKRNAVGTHKFQGQWNMFDQIIVSGELLTAQKGLKTSPDCFSVFTAPYLLTEDKRYFGLEPFRTYKGPVYIGGFSDHLPVVLDLY